MDSNNPSDSNISPISCIPPEILSLFFVEYINMPEDPGYAESYYFSRLRRLYLASVCQFWRQVACDTSELWAVCWLNYSQTQLNSIWLSRTGTRQFDIDGASAFTTYNRERTRFPINPVLSSIAPYMNRCRSFAITYSMLSGEKSKKYKFRAPNLISCTVVGSQHTPSPWLINLIFLSNKLETLNLDVLPKGLKISSTSLKNICLLHPPQLKILLSILSKSTSLRSLTIGDSLPVRGPQTAVTHILLTNLELSFEYLDDMIIFFDFLTLPSLKSLTIHIELNEIEPEDLERFHTFLQRSRCSLEKLVLDNVDGDGSPVLDLLHHETLSSLQMLTLSDFALEESLLFFLTDKSNLPCLRELHLKNVWVTEDGWGDRSLSNMVIARRTPATVDGSAQSVLEYFTLSFHDLHRCGSSFEMEEYKADKSRIEDLCRPSGDSMGSFVAELGMLVLESDLEELSGGSDEDDWDVYEEQGDFRGDFGYAYYYED